MRTSLAGSYLLLLGSLIAAGCSASDKKGTSGAGQGGDEGTHTGSGGDGSGNGGSPGIDPITGGRGGADTTARDGGSTVPLGPVSIDDCPGMLAGDLAQKLQAGGAAGAIKWLYPYDGTVFPGGLLPPLLQWSGPAADGVYVHMKSTLFEYKGCFGANSNQRLPLPKDVWAKATGQNKGVKDPLTIEISTISGGSVSGPAKETWTVALGSLKGVVYYDTYDSPLAGNKGAVMKITAGAEAPTAFVTATDTGCISCHSVSANGAALIAAHHYLQGGGTDSSASFNLTGRPNAQPPAYQSALDEAGFGGLFPDGSKFMSMGSPSSDSGFGAILGGLGLGGILGGGTGSSNVGGNVMGMAGPRDARLFDTKTGTKLAAPGWDGVIKYANMPMFSPDGKHIAFNHHEDSQGHTLAMMDVDASSNTFSNLRILYKDATRFVGWPVFTSDSKSIIFVLGNEGSYTSFAATARSNLFVVDIDSKMIAPLSWTDGKKGAATYLPGGARDESLSFYPTMSPVSSGGYSWMFFTSERTYGNVITDPISANGFAPGAIRYKKIWVAAIGLNTPAGKDPSHPAFYLPGQEEASGNHRAFPSLDSCQAEAGKCGSGTDCCKGFCSGGTCKEPEDHRCAELDEKCAVAADCCDKSLSCIGGYCGFDAPR